MRAWHDWSLKNSLCVYHAFLDNDYAGRAAFNSAESEGPLNIEANTFINWMGSSDSDFEDCLEVMLHKQKVHDEYGVNLEGARFRGNKQWSDRVRDTFLTQGK